MTKIILKDGSFYSPDPEFLSQLAELYDKINVQQELKKIAGWNLSNPGRRKTPRGIKRHIGAWLSRANDAAPIVHIPPPSNGYDLVVEAYDILCKSGHDEFKHYCINHDMPIDDIEAVELRFSGQHSYEKAEKLAKGIG